MNGKLGVFFSSVLLITSLHANASVYETPKETEVLIGQTDHQFVGEDDTVVTIAKRFDVGHNAILNTNPQVNFKYPLREGERLQIPTMHLLPNEPRKGIVVNLPEMRMYYYVPHTSKIATYPIGIGKIGKTIPIQHAVITKKVENPTWVPPEDIRQFNLAQGVIVPQVMPAGPDNPLGPYAIYMSIPTFLIHSTIFPESIGKRASFGCIRMYEKDIQDFFPSITPGIPVVIIDSPIKLGWQNQHLYIEAYTPLEERQNTANASLKGAVSMISHLTSQEEVLVDWQAVSFIEKERDGVPHEIGRRI